jgi:hypothetical protein
MGWELVDTYRPEALFHSDEARGFQPSNSVGLTNVGATSRMNRRKCFTRILGFFAEPQERAAPCHRASQAQRRWHIVDEACRQLLNVRYGALSDSSHAWRHVSKVPRSDSCTAASRVLILSPHSGAQPVTSKPIAWANLDDTNQAQF